MSIVTAEPYTS